jgi:hypothetical protein
MNHQPFKDWLLSEEKLPADQAAQLQEHLVSCPTCRDIQAAWLDVKTELIKAPQACPQAGFTDRWLTCLADHQARVEKRNGLLSVGFTVLMILALLTLVISQLWSLLQAPGPYLAGWFGGVVNLISLIFTVQNAISPFSWEMPFYSLIGGVLVAGIISFMSVLWLATYRKLSMARRYI